MKAEVAAGNLSLWGMFFHLSEKEPIHLRWLANGWVGVWTLVLPDSRMWAKYFVPKQTWGKSSSEWFGLESLSLKRNPVSRKARGPLYWNKHIRSFLAHLRILASRLLFLTPHCFSEQATSLEFLWEVGIFWTSATSATCWCRGCEPLHA